MANNFIRGYNSFILKGLESDRPDPELKWIVDGTVYYCTDSEYRYVKFNEKWYRDECCGSGGGGGDSYSLGIDHEGKAWAWGYNNVGQLGTNDITSRITPVQVCGNITFCQISAGSAHSLGIDNQEIEWGWGGNDDGQLGTNDTTSRLTPTSF